MSELTDKLRERLEISYKDINLLCPCYDPIKYIPETWSGTLVDILKMEEIPAKDRLWVCVRHTFMTDRQLHLYGLACVRQCEHLSTDPRVKECNDVVERYLAGQATSEELSSAESAAESAAEAAESASRSAESAARSAAWSAESAAWSAESAARSAESAARSAAWSAESAARSAESAASAAAE